MKQREASAEPKKNFRRTEDTTEAPAVPWAFQEL